MTVTINAYKANNAFYQYWGDDIDERLAIEARKYWLHMLSLAVEPDEYALKKFIIVGSQYMGKTHAMNELVWWINNIPGNEGDVAAVQLHDLRPIYNPRYKALWKKPIQVLIFEDAGRFWDARNSMGNKEKTYDFFEVRHIYEDMKWGTKGQIFMIFNVQTWSLLDVRVRDTSEVVIMKNYFPTDWFDYLIKNPMHRTFARDFTENASIFNMQEEKQFCIGRTNSKREFMWALPYREPDPITGKMTKVKKLVAKHELIHALDMLSLETEVLQQLEKDLLNDQYFEQKTMKQLHGWLKRTARYKYNAGRLRLTFSDTDFNNIIKDVADKRFYINLARTRKFSKYLYKKLPERFPLEVTPLERLLVHAKKEARKQALFYLKNNQIKDILKEILFDHPISNNNNEEDSGSCLDPNKRPNKKEQVINAVHAEGVTDIERIRERTGFDNKTIIDIVYGYNTIFRNLSEEKEHKDIKKGVYCLQGYNFLQNELMKYKKKVPKMLKI